MSKLTLADSNFLIGESRETPMHVGGLYLYRFPEGVDEQDFLDEVHTILTSSSDLRPPFAERLSQGPLLKTGLFHHWVPDRRFDLDYHVRHSALPKPGRYRELFALTSRLHSTLLDRSRPLWEMHLIEGLRDRKFATYLKVHHSVVDGVAAMHLTQSMLSKTSRGRVRYSPLSKQAWQKYKEKKNKERKRDTPDPATAASVVERLSAQVGSATHVLDALSNYANVWIGRNTKLNAPWHQVPKSVLSGNISGSRRFVAQSWPFERVRGVGKALGGTLNDAVLAMCAGALRLYLMEAGQLPDAPIKALVPVSLRVADDVDSANAVGFILANLATHVADPAERFDTIQTSMRAGKDVYTGLSADEATLLTQISLSPLLLTNILGLAARVPACSLSISNVPGPRNTMYWNGARLEGIYPASIVLHGQAMNITLVSYGDQLDFGITACRQSLPHVQRLIEHLEDSLSELEELAGLTPGKEKIRPVNN